MLDTNICAFIMREQPKAVLYWDCVAVDATSEIKLARCLAGTPIGPTDAAISEHSIAASALLVTNYVRKFERVPDLVLEDLIDL